MLKVGDTVEIYREAIGEVTYIDEENCSADVEVEEYNDTVSYSVPFVHIKNLSETVGEN